MNLPELIQTYGYGAVFAGTLLEAETVLLVAGFAAHRGYLDLPTVIGVAIVGSFLANQVWFYLGRRHGDSLLARYPKFTVPVARAHELLARYNTPLILTVRFVFGLRTVLPFVLGMSSIPTLRFEILNLAGAIFWSVAVAAGGYLFGHLFERALGDLRHYEEILLAVLAVGGLIYFWYTKRKAQKPVA
jgi:membrane protein DedA with SNARE-associated domain